MAWLCAKRQGRDTVLADLSAGLALQLYTSSLRWKKPSHCVYFSKRIILLLGIDSLRKGVFPPVRTAADTLRKTFSHDYLEEDDWLVRFL